MSRADTQPTAQAATTWSRRAALLRRVMSEERSVSLLALRILLRGASWLYGLGVRLRNATFDLGLRRIHRLPVPVIAVGNLTTGGTGKTPVVVTLAEQVRARGLVPAILTRGYRRSGGGVGQSDEVKLLERSLPGIDVVVDPDRVAGGRRAIENGAQILILDDGFQHRRLARDQDLVLIDAREPFGGEALLPRGLLREPPTGLRRAHGVIVTRADRVSQEIRQLRRESIVALAQRDLPIVFEKHAPSELVEFASQRVLALTELRSRRVIAFSGIGDPDTLRETLENCGARVVGSLDFGDHHEFESGDLEAIESLATQHSDALVVTTEKDAMRLDRVRLRFNPWILRIRAEECEDAGCGALRFFLEGVIDRALEARSLR